MKLSKPHLFHPKTNNFFVMLDNDLTTNSLPKNSRKSKTPMPIKLDLPQPEILKPKITIFGVGGAGGNALNNMIRSSLEGVEFVAANTDSQALMHSLTNNRIQLGVKTTKGLGAGSFPDRGRMAAEENVEEIENYLEGCNMVFIAAGMGGGTGTGAAPVIAKLAREREILTVGVVTKPFHFEGKYRMETAEAGIEELKKYVDTLIVIPNQNLFRIANESTTFESAFKMADDVLQAGVRGVTDLITMPGLVNLDFADIRTIMTKMGKAMMGTGEAAGENRAVLACEAAIANPLLDDISIKGAKGVLVNMTGGPDMTLFEADMAVNTIRKEVDPNANIIFGSAFDESMKGKIRISVVATGIDSEEFRRDLANKKETTEPSRFRASSKNGNDKETHKSFFDPGTPAKPTKVEIDEISAENFQSKKAFLAEENPSYSDQVNHHKNDDDFKFDDDFLNNIDKNHEKKATHHDESHHHASHKNEEVRVTHKHSSGSAVHHDNSKAHHETAKVHNDKKVAKTATKKEKSKKDSGGFSLFSFMNNKEKDEDNFESEDLQHSNKENAHHNDFFESKPVNYPSSHSPTNTHKSSNEAEKKRQQFFNDTIFDEGEVAQSADKIDDDIINVPAFFRRKK